VDGRKLRRDENRSEPRMGFVASVGNGVGVWRLGHSVDHKGRCKGTCPELQPAEQNVVVWYGSTLDGFRLV